MKTKNKVGFDSAFLMIAIRKDKIAASVDKAKERVDYLISELSKQAQTILIPTPALSEMLVHAGSAAGTYLDELQKSSRFKIVPFDVKASIEVALDIAASIKKGDKKGGAAGTWAKANFDRQIAAICKAGDAHTIYTDDEDVEKHAKRMGLDVKRLHDLPLPPSKAPLFESLELMEQEQEADAKGEESKPATAQILGGERPAENKTTEPIRKIRFEDEEKAKEIVPETPKPADKGGPDKGSS